MRLRGCKGSREKPLPRNATERDRHRAPPSLITRTLAKTGIQPNMSETIPEYQPIDSS